MRSFFLSVAVSLVVLTGCEQSPPPQPATPTPPPLAQLAPVPTPSPPPANTTSQTPPAPAVSPQPTTASTAPTAAAPTTTIWTSAQVEEFLKDQAKVEAFVKARLKLVKLNIQRTPNGDYTGTGEREDGEIWEVRVLRSPVGFKLGYTAPNGTKLDSTILNAEQ